MRLLVLYRRKYFIWLVTGLLFLCLLLLLNGEAWHSVKKEVLRTYGSPSYRNIGDFVKEIYNGCDGNFQAFGHQFAVLKNVVIKPGEEQFYIPCTSTDKASLKYSFDYGHEGTHLNDWLKSTVPYSDAFTKLQMYGTLKNLSNIVWKTRTETKRISIENKFVIAVLRYEYANLYHTMTDWYNVFLVATLLDIPLDKLCVILYGGYASGHLDPTWSTLFGDVFYLSNLTEPFMAPSMAWNIIGYESPLNYHGQPEIPFLGQFVNFFLSQHNIKDWKALNCEKLVITFLWRRDYVAHPGNPSGLISRKVKNEDEILAYFRQQYPDAVVNGTQIDQMSFSSQLQVITNTDILISMHGAGLSHILFLPTHAAVVEMFTLYWKKYLGFNHFKSFARWHGVKYRNWQNLNPSNEYPDFYTYIPPAALNQLVNDLYVQMCH